MFDHLRLRIALAMAGVREREEGQALVEYALILFLVSIAAVATLKAIGTNVDAVLGKIRDDLAAAG
jgi:Flp pilus assembly pilin Flp